MRPKVAVIGLAVIVVVFVLALVYGAARPDSAGADPRQGVERALGWLQSSRAVTFDDLVTANQPCLDPPNRRIEVGGGQSCRLELPDSGSLTLCTTQGSATVSADGADYPAQRFDPGDLDCEQPPSINLYDTANTLTVLCSLGATCQLPVLEP